MWRLWPMIWDLGGDVVAADGKHIGFADQGVRALETLAGLSRDKSVYVDPKPGGEQMYQVFMAYRMAMVGTGPWQLPDIIGAGVDYDVVPLPTYSGRPVTISGPDTWTVFDNGSARSRAAVEFVRWMMRPAQDARWDLSAGSLPLSSATAARPEWRRRLPTDQRPRRVHRGAGLRPGASGPRGLSADLPGTRRGDRLGAARQGLPHAAPCAGARNGPTPPCSSPGDPGRASENLRHPPTRSPRSPYSPRSLNSARSLNSPRSPRSAVRVQVTLR